jgi:hypothetical protein
MRITLAPLLILAGLVIEIIAIFKKPRTVNNQGSAVKNS